MPSTPCAVELAAAADPALLAEDAQALFANGDFYAGADWYRMVRDTALPAGAAACFVEARIGGRAALVLPLLRLADGRMQSLTTPYTCLFQPPVAAGLNHAALTAIGAALAEFCKARAPLLRLDALDPSWPGWAPLLAGFRQGGLRALAFDHFGNWHAPVAGLAWADYLAQRDGALRETVRRRGARATRNPDTGFELLQTPPEIEPGIDAFEAVYAQSWKQPEPHPRFNAALIRLAAAQGVLRLGVMRAQGRPIAVQVWIVTRGQASVLKLAHVEADRALSPGTVLTAWMIQALLKEGVAELDFGRGDDAYKQNWAGLRRQRGGWLLVDPRRPAGLAALARHGLGHLKKLQRS